MAAVPSTRLSAASPLVPASAVSLTSPEIRFAATQERLFRDLGLDIRSSFLWPSDRERRIHVLDGGAGEPLLMIHGGNSIAASWAPLLTQLGDGFRVIAPDRPGCGLSHRQGYRGVAFRQHAISFVSDVMDGLGLERATLVGNSMGGFWSLLFALARPDRVSRVILLGEPAGSSPSPAVRFRLGATPILNHLLFSTVLRPRADERIFRGLMAQPSRAGRALLECAYAGARLPGANEAWRTMLELVAAPWRAVELTYSLIPELPRLESPVLFAWGDRDFAPPEDGLALSRHLAHARFEVVPDAGHLVWIDQPAAVARLVADFAA